MRLLPRTLFGQVLLALFAGLIAVQTAGFWLMLDERARFGQRLQGGTAAQRIAGAISILDRAAPADRSRLLDALNVPPLELSLDEPWRPALRDVPEDVAQLFERMSRELARPTVLQVVAMRHAVPPRHPGPPGMVGAYMEHRPLPPGPPPLLFIEGQARLQDGAILTFRHGVRQPPPDAPHRLLMLLVLLGVSVALLSGWTVRRLTRPLAALADAASGLAQNLERPPLPESGPLEVVRAARAFNAMQRDLQRYVQTRAQALAAVSHDLRLPITRLRLRLERMSDEKLREGMESDIADMEAMIANTLEFLRAGSTAEKTQKLDLNALLETAAEDARMLGAQVDVHGAVSGPVMVRPQALRRCLDNLLDNARRYGGGRIDVTVTENAAEIRVCIEDRGPGIPPEDLERVFEPYVRLERSRAKHTGGSGLGLAIARTIARGHGGDVRLFPRESGGTSAVLTLPLPQAAVRMAA